jgi:hypothetical protein
MIGGERTWPYGSAPTNTATGCRQTRRTVPQIDRDNQMTMAGILTTAMLTHAFGERGLATYVVLAEQREVYLVRTNGHDSNQKRVPVCVPVRSAPQGEPTGTHGHSIGVYPGQRFRSSGRLILPKLTVR